MYTVTCPSCGYAIELAYARIGAAGRCPSCSKVVPVDESTLRRPGQTPRPMVSAADKLQPDLPKLDAEGNPIGLSGLSHLLDQSGPAPKPRVSPSRPSADPLKPPRRRAAEPPAPASRRMLIVAVVAVAAVALAGFAVWYIARP